MNKFLVVLALVWTALLATIAIELRPIARLAGDMVDNPPMALRSSAQINTALGLALEQMGAERTAGGVIPASQRTPSRAPATTAKPSDRLPSSNTR